MTDWAAQLEDLGIGTLVPAVYARFRPAVIDGVAFFLDGLSAERLGPILDDQAALPENAGPAERLISIARHSPVLHKLGQVLARDRRLSGDLRAQLQTLESMPAGWTSEELCVWVQRELGPAALADVAFPEPPLAEASVAVVLPMEWRPSGRVPRRGVFKLLKPGIEARLAEDLALLQRAGPWLDRRCAQYGLPAIAYADTFDTVRQLLAQEIDLGTEQAHLLRAAKTYRGHTDIVIPELFRALSTPRLTAMTRVDGRKVTEVGGLPTATRERIAALAVEALLAVPVWASDDMAPFHADPHAGNLFLTNDGQLGLVDWSLTGQLSKRLRVDLTQLALGAVCFDAARMTATVADLAVAPVDTPAVRRIADQSLSRLVQGSAPSLDWLVGLLDAMVLEAGVRMPGDLLLFRKMLHTVLGVVQDVAAGPVADGVLVRCFLQRFAAEAPMRAMAPPFWRGFDTHLANADLWQAAAQAPLALLSAWNRLVR